MHTGYGIYRSGAGWTVSPLDLSSAFTTSSFLPPTKIAPGTYGDLLMSDTLNAHYVTMSGDVTISPTGVTTVGHVEVGILNTGQSIPGGADNLLWTDGGGVAGWHTTDPFSDVVATGSPRDFMLRVQFAAGGVFEFDVAGIMTWYSTGTYATLSGGGGGHSVEQSMLLRPSQSGVTGPTNRTGGDLVVALQTPEGTGTEASFRITRDLLGGTLGATTQFKISGDSSLGAYAAFTTASSQTGYLRFPSGTLVATARNPTNLHDIQLLATNFTGDGDILIGDGTFGNFTKIFSPNGHWMIIGSSAYMELTTAAMAVGGTVGNAWIQFDIGTTQIIHFMQTSATSSTLQVDAQTADTATHALTIKGQDAYSAAVTHLDGGDVVITPGAKHGAGANGNVVLTTGYNLLIQNAGSTPSTTGRINIDASVANTILAGHDQFNGADLPLITNSAGGVYFFGINASSNSYALFGANGNSLAFHETANGCIFNATKATFSSTPAYFDSGSNVTIGGTVADFGGGVGLLALTNRTTAPTSNPTGYLVYAEGGALLGRGSSGTITTIGPSDLFDHTEDKHCPRCSRDFGHRWENQKMGSLVICMWCLSEMMDKVLEHHPEKAAIRSVLGDATFIVRKAA